MGCAAAGSPQANDALRSVVALATSATVKMYDCDLDPSSGGAAAVAADAARAANVVAAGGSIAELAASSIHALEQQAHAHCQQLCPELAPDASAVRCYEADKLRQASVAFQANAEVRETAP